MVGEWEDFLKWDICDKLIDLSIDKLSEAEVLGKSLSWRTADGCWLEDGIDSCVKEFRQRISELVRLPIENLESLHIVKYDIGGEFKPHHDFFHEGEGYYSEMMSEGGQRTKTALVYLNDDYTGGETFFPRLSVKVNPKKGKLVIWNNLDSKGEPNYQSIHTGLPVISGVKWIAVVWIRVGKFR